MGIPLQDSMRTQLLEKKEDIRQTFPKDSPEAVRFRKDSSAQESLESPENLPIEKIQKSTWKKIRDWCTRAYRISKVAEKNPERVKTAGRHIIVLGMILGMAPTVLSTLTKTGKNSKNRSPHSPNGQHYPSPRLKKDSERMPILHLEDHDDEEMLAPPFQTTTPGDIDSESFTKTSVEPIILYSRCEDTPPPVSDTSIKGPKEERHAQQQSETPRDIREDNERQAISPSPEEMLAAFRAESETLLSSAQETTEISWDHQDIELSLYPSSHSQSGQNRLQDEPLFEGDFRLGEFSSRSYENTDLLRQLSIETYDQLPLERAYEMAMKIAVNGIIRGKEFFKKRSPDFDRGISEHSPTVRIRTGFEDILSLGDTRVKISLRKIMLKGQIDIQVPWEDGEMNLEAIAKIKPFDEMPLDSISFRANYSHPVLGGNLQARGFIDYEPLADNPYTIGARVQFRRVIADHAHFFSEANYQQPLGGEAEFGFFIGLSFEWGPGAKEEPNRIRYRSRVEEKLRRKLAPERLLARAASRGQRMYEKSLEEQLED